MLTAAVAAAIVLPLLVRIALARRLGADWVAIAPPLVGPQQVATAPGSRRARAAALVSGLAAAYLGVGLVAAVDTARRGPVREILYAVGAVLPGTAADGVLAAGDVIVAVDGAPVQLQGPDGSRASLVERVQAGGEVVAIAIRRGGAPREVSVRPAVDAATGNRRLGVQLVAHIVHEDVAAPDLAAEVVRAPAEQLAAIAAFAADAIAGDDGVVMGPTAAMIVDPGTRRAMALLYATAIGLLLALSDLVALVRVLARPQG